MSWNHHVVKHTAIGGGSYLAIHEVYSAEDEPDKCGSMTVDPVQVLGDDLEGLRWTLEKMLEACHKPIIDADAPDLKVYSMSGEVI